MGFGALKEPKPGTGDRFRNGWAGNPSRPLGPSLGVFKNYFVQESLCLPETKELMKGN